MPGVEAGLLHPELTPDEAGLCARVHEAQAQGQDLRIVGSGSKSGRWLPAYGWDAAPHAHMSQSMDVRTVQGVVDYRPDELLVTVRCGTRLAYLEQLLAERQQWLAFDPVYGGPDATVGGMLACALQGAARPFCGRMRDYVLGVRCLNGLGEVLNFGGQVMKNVAGFDVSRLLVGSHGALAVLLAASIKVLPRPRQLRTWCLHHSGSEALLAMQQWMQSGWPIRALVHVNGQTYIRLQGEAPLPDPGGEPLPNDTVFWQAWNERCLPCWQGQQRFWRILLPLACPVLQAAPNAWLDWGGALRWVPQNSVDEVALRHEVRVLGGRMALWPCPAQSFCSDLDQRIRHAFDPHDVFVAAGKQT